MKNKGAVLIISMLIISILLASGAVVLNIIISESEIVRLTGNRKIAFYLAEGGLERAKVIINSNSNWFTDLPHMPQDDAGWLVDEADGHIEDLGEGKFKIVRESGKNIIYSIGFIESSKKGLPISIIKAEYQNNPFKLIKWEIL